MQMVSRKWFQGWARMALFAMFAVLSSPALAFTCCCAPDVAPVPAPQTLAPSVQAPSVAHPGCDGHAAAGDASAQNAGSSRVSTSSLPQSASVAAPSQPCFESLCECAHASSSALAFVAEQSSSSFSPLVLGVAAQAFSPALAPLPAACFAFSSKVARPRGPDLASRAGRAPPAFSL